MSGGPCQVREVARLAGVTVRNLHHDDAIGLVRPPGRTARGHRLYSDADLPRLREVLIGRKLGFSLAEISRLQEAPGATRRETLLHHREALRRRITQTEAMVRSVEAALAIEEGTTDMDAKQIFDGFDPVEYEDEVKDRWGDTEAYRISTLRAARYNAEVWKRFQAEGAALLEGLAALMQEGAAPESAAAMDYAEQHRLQIDQWFCPCSHAMQEKLAEMYLADDRFRQTYESVCEGLTGYLVAAIRANAARAPAPKP